MIKGFENLTEKEHKILIKAPALLSVLAASGDNEISNGQKADAIKMAHLKTFTANPLLIPYYKEVEKHFTKYFQETVNKYAPFDEVKTELLKTEIGLLNNVILKLDSNYKQILHNSLKGYAEHVRKADKSVLENFIFPIPINGLTT